MESQNSKAHQMDACPSALTLQCEHFEVDPSHLPMEHGSHTNVNTLSRWAIRPVQTHKQSFIYGGSLIEFDERAEDFGDVLACIQQ